MINIRHRLKLHLLISFLMFGSLIILFPIILGNISLTDILAIFDSEKSDISPNTFIFWQSRVPRVLMALFTGGALTLSGVVFQSVLRNPLSEPYLLGVSAGAAFGKIVFTVILLYSAVTLTPQMTNILNPIACFIGGIIPITIMALIYFRIQITPVSLILTGLMLNVLFMSGIMLFQYLADFTNMKQMQIWWLGSLDVIGYGKLVIIAPLIVLTWIILIFTSPKLNILSLDFDTCKHLGVNPQTTAFYFLTIATVLAALSVSMAGPIAFVGLIVPHVLRILIGADNRFLISLSLFYGGIFLATADYLGQVSHHLIRLLVPTTFQIDIPVGIITSIIGAIMFLSLLIRQKNCKYL